MEFRETLLAAQRNQQQKSSENLYYKARFDPPKKEQKNKDRLSANIQKFLAKKDEEERQKKLEAQKKREELLAMRDPKALRKIQKTLKVIKSANKSAIADAIDRDNTAVTRDGPDQPDQDDYGYVSQEANALYEKMMQKYSKIPDEPKFSVSQSSVKKDLNGTRERVKHALLHEDDPVPHKRRRKKENGEQEPSPPREPEKKKDEKPEKPKVRKPMPPPMDFNQLLKLAEQKKSEPLEIGVKKTEKESEPERPMTKKQRREYEEEMARKQRRLERMEAEKGGGKRIPKDSRPIEKERKPDPGGFGRIPKVTDKVNGNYPKPQDRDRDRNERDRNDRDRERNERDRDRERNERDRDRERNERDRDRERNERDRDRQDREREYKDWEKEKLLISKERAILEREKAILEREKAERERLRLDKERLDKLKAERERIDREMERLNKDREKLEKAKMMLETKTVEKKHLDKSLDRSKLMSKEQNGQNLKPSIDLKTQNTYRIDKNSNEKKVITNKDGRYMNGHSSQVKSVPKGVPNKDLMKDRIAQGKQKLLSDGSQKLNSQKMEDRRLMEKGMKRTDEKNAQAGSSKMSNSFDFDKHVSSLKGRDRPSMKQKSQQKPKRRLESDSEYDSEMDDFIDDEDENLDYSRHIKEIFGYDKSKYRYIDDDDDPNMESSFVQVQREEYISKKQGILEDLEDMRKEAMEKAKKGKKKRRISDD